MSGSVPIQIRGTPGNGPPVGLVERQLSVEMDNGNLWVGVPVSIDSTGRIQLNPRRTPAGGNQYQVLGRGTGANLEWQWPGGRPGNSVVLGNEAATNASGGNFNIAIGFTSYYYNSGGSSNIAIGRNALGAGTSGSNSTAVGDGALYSNSVQGDNVGIGGGAMNAKTSGDLNVAVGVGAGRYNADASPMTAAFSSVFIGAGTRSQMDSRVNQVVIGANAVGHGSRTATIGADSGPNAMTQFWVGGRDLLAVGSLPPYAPAPGTLTAVPNDGAVRDVTSVFLSEGLWIILLQIWMNTSTATPWFYYAGGINVGSGQTNIDDPTEFATTAGTVTAANFRHLNMFPVPAPGGTLVAAVRAQNPTNSGTYDCHVVIDAVQLR